MNGRILFITHQLSRTGAPIVLLDMIKLCKRERADIDVITMMDGELGEQLHNMGIDYKIMERFYPEKERLLSEWSRYNLVVANTIVTYEVIHVLNGSKIPVIWWLHEGRQYFEYFASVIPHFGTIGSNIHTYAVSPYVKSVIKDIYKCDVPMMHFAVYGYEGEADKHYARKRDVVKFLTAGTFSKIKGQDVLAAAIRMLPDEYMKKAEFSFCGNEAAVDEEVYTSVCELEKDYNNVHMLHQLTRQQTISCMEDADCLIVPSRIEPLSAVAIEMMMTGGTVLCTDVCGIAYYVEDGENGYVTSSDDPQRLAESIIRVIDDYDNWEHIGKIGHQTYMKHFSREAVEPDIVRIVEKYMNLSKRIIFIKGKLETLDYFIDQLADSADKLGIEYYIINTGIPESYGEALEEYVKLGRCAVFMINQIGLLLSENGQNYWKERNIPVYDLIVDHPYNYADALECPPADINVIVIDRNHEKFIRKYYPEIRNIYFMPDGENEAEGRMQYKDRPIDILYVGDCQLSTPFIEIPDMSDKGMEMYSTVYNILLQKPGLSIEETMELYFEAKGGYTKEQVKQYILNYGFIISDNVRRYYKLKTMHALESTGASIVIYGKGWDARDEAWQPNVSINARISSEECNRMLGKAKIGLNCMPWFKDGCSERVFNIMLNGAVCLTDTSKYLLERFEHGNELVFYNLEDMEKMKQNVCWLLENPNAASQIAQAGYEAAIRNDTWLCRMGEIAKMMGKMR